MVNCVSDASGLFDQLSSSDTPQRVGKLVLQDSFTASCDKAKNSVVFSKLFSFF